MSGLEGASLLCAPERCASRALCGRALRRLLAPPRSGGLYLCITSIATGGDSRLVRKAMRIQHMLGGAGTAGDSLGGVIETHRVSRCAATRYCVRVDCVAVALYTGARKNAGSN